MKSDKRKAETLKIRLVTSRLERLRGLLFTSPDGLDADALVLVPCSAVHTLLMRYPIDIAFLSRDGEVLRSVRKVEPGRLRIACLGAAAVMERPSGRVGWWPSVGERVVCSPGTSAPATSAPAATTATGAPATALAPRVRGDSTMPPTERGRGR